MIPGFGHVFPPVFHVGERVSEIASFMELLKTIIFGLLESGGFWLFVRVEASREVAFNCLMILSIEISQT